MTITVLLTSCENIERSNLIAEFEDLEEYRVWVTEKSIDEKDSVYHERKTFKAFGIRAPRSVTWYPIISPSRSLNVAIDCLAGRGDGR